MSAALQQELEYEEELEHLVGSPGSVPARAISPQVLGRVGPAAARAALAAGAAAGALGEFEEEYEGELELEGEALYSQVRRVYPEEIM